MIIRFFTRDVSTHWSRDGVWAFTLLFDSVVDNHEWQHWPGRADTHVQISDGGPGHPHVYPVLPVILGPAGIYLSSSVVFI